jgi:hypothetical protein
MLSGLAAETHFFQAPENAIARTATSCNNKINNNNNYLIVYYNTQTCIFYC